MVCRQAEIAERAVLLNVLRRYEEGDISAELALAEINDYLAHGPEESTEGARASEPRVYRERTGGGGWRVTFQVHCVRHFRYFADVNFGGAEQSHQAAVQFASFADAYKDLRTLALRFVVRKNTRSGVPGVTRIAAGGRRRAFWMSYWTDPISRRKRSKRFAIHKFGEDGARAQAVAWREAGMRTLLDDYHELQQMAAELPKTLGHYKP